MDYEEFVAGVQNYWALREKGLNKQANAFLFEFADRFENEVPDLDSKDAILFRFCEEYLDGRRFPGKELPFQMNKLLSAYLRRECKKNRMPQMRWALQMFGPCFPDCDGPYLGERAYMHKDCDEQTVRLYFNEQVYDLWLGQHHFPDYCLISQEEFEAIAATARKIISEKTVDPKAVEEFEYYVKLYELFFSWEANGRKGDFCLLCKEAGLDFEEGLTICYE